MNGSEFIWRQEIEGRSTPWWLRRVDPVDGTLLLLAIATATFGAMLILNGALPLSVGA